MEENKAVTFSIIIPYFNSHDFIKKCFFSLENQEMKNFEVVIVDDCSREVSYKKLLEHCKNTRFNLKIFRLNKNSGPGVARNKGIKEAKGKYLLFCDSDDWYENNLTKILTIEIDKNKSDIIFFDYNKIIKEKKMKANSLDFFKSNFSKEFYIANVKASLCCMCIKRSLFNNIKIPNLYNGEDIAVIPILVSKSEKVSFIKDSLYNYYFRENSSSNKVSEKIPNQLLEAFEYIEKNLFDVNKEVKEFLGIKIVLYGITLNLFKLDEKNKIKKIILDFEDKYKNWSKNEYLKNLSISKRIYLYCIKKRFFIINFLFAKLHEKILNF